MQMNILKKAKTAGLMLLALGWTVFASTTPVLADGQATSVTNHSLITGGQTSTSPSSGGYATVNPDGTPIYNSDGSRNYVTAPDGSVTQVRRLEANGASAYKQQTTSERLSSAFSYEARMGKKALDNAWGSLMSGNVVGAGGELLGYARNVVGDVVGATLEVARDGVNWGFDRIDDALDVVSDIPIIGAISDYTLKPLANVARFAVNGVISVVEGIGNFLFGKSNLECRQEKIDNIYKSGCYPCLVVKSLISAFLNGVAFLESISVEAGSKIVILGFVLWLLIYVIQQVSSFKNIEPMSMINDMLIMAFKVLGAWIVIQVGFQLVVDYVIVPFLGWGIDFGTYVLAATTTATGLDISGTQVDTSYLFTDGGFSGKTAATLAADVSASKLAASASISNGGILPAHLLNNLMTYVGAVDGTVTNHMKLGHMVTCHATHHGAWNIGIMIPNIWIWLCGAAIWFAGFMMTLSILYYLVDMSFKLGFALIALPIVTGLWPFNITRGRFTACIQIILHSTGIFVFLALTTATGLVLVDSAIMAGQIAEQPGSIPAEAILQATDRDAGITELYEAIEEGDNEKVSDTFMLWGSSFLLIMFAYLYAIKLIGSTITDYVDQFFSSKVLGKQSPMHHRLTQATDMVKQKGLEAASFAWDGVKHQSKLGFTKFANKKFGGKGSGDDEEDDGIMEKADKIDKGLDKLSKGKFSEEENQQKKSGADQAKAMANLEAKDKEKMDQAANGKKDGGSAAAQAMEAAGDQLEQAGKTMDEAAKNIRNAGKQVDAAGSAGAVFSFGGTKAASTAARASTEASAAALQAGAAVLKTTGKIVKQTAKVVKKVDKATKKVKKITNKASKTAQKAMKNINNQMKQGGNGSQNGSEQKGNNPSNHQEDNNDLVNTMASSATGSNKGKK